DLARAPQQLAAVLDSLPEGRVLSTGLIDGRNIWRADLDQALALAQRARKTVGSDRLWLASSCSLLHVPVDLVHETALAAPLKSWLAFARQKIAELAVVRSALHGEAD